MTIHTEVRGINRREFLYYMWGAGAGLLGIGVCGAATWFAVPHDDDKLFPIDLKTLPLPDTDPIGNPVGKFWLANTENGLLALYMVCPFERETPTLYKWVPTNNRFECPRCGGKYQLDGTYIEGIAFRNLHRYVIRVTTPYSSRKTSPDGEPVNIADATSIIVDVRRLIRGKLHDRSPAITTRSTTRNK
jgi:cytochrome b6-f complex iron-sulfur subunit